MQAVTTIGLDIAKSVFQIHGVDAAGNVIVRRQLKRRYVLPFFQKLPPCLVGTQRLRRADRPHLPAEINQPAAFIFRAKTSRIRRGSAFSLFVASARPSCRCLR
jgi:hypothetical protein